jgi:hypothetical protein
LILRRIGLTFLVLIAEVSCGRRQSAPPIPDHLVQLCGDPGLAGITRIQAHKKRAAKDSPPFGIG